MSDNDRSQASFRSSPTGPRIAPPRAVPPPASSPPLHLPRRGRLFWSTVIFALMASGVGIRAYRDLSRPEAWAYWKDQYYSPSLSATVIGHSLNSHKQTLEQVGGYLIIAMGVFFLATPFVSAFNREWHSETLLRLAGRGGPLQQRDLGEQQ